MIYVVATTHVKTDQRGLHQGCGGRYSRDPEGKGLHLLQISHQHPRPESVRGGRALGEPRPSQRPWQRAAHEDVAGVFRAVQGVADGDRDHQRWHGREVLRLR